jgi:glucosamine kinase
MTTASPAGPLFVGVDGGGTGCRARIEDANGNLLGNGIAGPAALRIGVDRALAEVEKACRAAAEDAGLKADALGSMHAAVGLAGVGRKGALEELLLRPHPFRSVIYAHDATIACIGAHGARDGGIVIIGTGSVGFAVVDGREVRIGGYGFPISDEGSGADLGLHAIRMALRAYDERAVGTSLTRDVMLRFRNDPFEAVAWMDHANATDYATFAPLVMRHADSGDPVARGIIREAAEQIGGLATSMQPWLAPDVQRRLVPVEGDAVDGALHLARRAAMKG